MMVHPIKTDDFGVSPFLETSICIHMHMYIYIYVVKGISVVDSR